MNKIDELKKLRDELNITVRGVENIQDNNVPSLYVSNHNCLMDIFYFPCALLKPVVSLVSGRLMYKKDMERKERVYKYLYPMPIEAHGGVKYADICLNESISLLENGISLNLFPEGAYISDKSKITRGRTGASRLLYGPRNIRPLLIPVSIDIKSDITNLDNYMPTDDEVEITFLDPIDYYEYYRMYMKSSTKEEKNALLHAPIDIAMQSIANNLGKPYSMEYIELYPKGNVIFEDGSVVDTNEAQNEEYIDMYERELKGYSMTLKQKIMNRE